MDEYTRMMDEQIRYRQTYITIARSLEIKNPEEVWNKNYDSEPSCKPLIGTDKYVPAMIGKYKKVCKKSIDDIIN